MSGKGEAVTPVKTNSTADSSQSGPNSKGGPKDPSTDASKKGLSSKSPEVALGLNNHGPMTGKNG